MCPAGRRQKKRKKKQAPPTPYRAPGAGNTLDPAEPGAGQGRAGQDGRGAPALFHGFRDNLSGGILTRAVSGPGSDASSVNSDAAGED